MLFGDFTLTTTMVTTATIYICQEGTNSPAATPEIVDLELDSAQFEGRRNKRGKNKRKDSSGRRSRQGG